MEWVLNRNNKEIKDKRTIEENELLSGSTDKSIRYWKFDINKNLWECKAVMEGHKDTVTSIRSLIINDDQLIFVSSSADCTVKVWSQKGLGNAIECIQTLNFGRKMIEAVALVHIPNTNSILLAAAGVDTNIHLFISNTNNNDNDNNNNNNNNIVFNNLLVLSGHYDWIRSLDYTIDENNDIYLASSSQDTKIRIWKMTKNEEETSITNKEEKNIISSNTNKETRVTSLSSKGYIIEIKESGKYSIMLESVLSAHTEWVYSIKWLPLIFNKVTNKWEQKLKLLSASMDRTMMIWEPTKHESIWINSVSVGEIGGNTLGFYGGIWSNDGNFILSNGYNSTFHLWKKSITKTTTTTATTNINDNSDNNDNSNNNDNNSDNNNKELIFEETNEEWKPEVTVTGHFGEVTDITWDNTKQYLISVSLDQSSRLFAPWISGNNNNSNRVTWHEISRPLIHGYDLNCVSFISNVNDRIVTGADEKVLRVFDAPQTTLNSLLNISNITTTTINGNSNSRPMGANVPPLGLSNKAVYNVSDMEVDAKFAEYEAPVPVPTVHTNPPFEDHLMQSTLWPELHKLYGHPNELVCVTCNYSGTIIASACKGTKPELSAIRLWSTSTWKEITSPLVAHTLTVAQLEFSHNDNFLLSVSRDRQFIVWKINENKEEGTITTQIVFKSKAHERIIWSGSWSLNDIYFATGSRDKLVKIWQQGNTLNNDWNLVTTITSEIDKGVTAVAWGPLLQISPNQIQYTLAIGFEDGCIAIYTSNIIDSKSTTTSISNWSLSTSFSSRITHISTVTRLRWQLSPINSHLSFSDKEKQQTIQLASSSSDCSVRLFSVSFSIK